MSSRCRLFHVDAFTRTQFCGNPARVVLDADDLSDAQMQTIATECNGETAFVLSPESGDHDVQIRFFTPHQEVPFVGHATIAAHYVLAKSGGRSTGVSKQRSSAGIGEIEVTQADGDYRIRLSLSPPSLGAIIPAHHRSRVLEALGISSPSVHTACPVQMLTKGGTRLLIGLKSTALLQALKPEMDALTRLTAQLGAAGYFVFAVAEQQPHFTTVARMFCPALGIPEDPVSGNAHGMLGTYLIAHGRLRAKNGVAAFRGHQGEAVRRPGIVDVAVTASGAVAHSVRSSGDAVIVYEAELSL
jgi:PhzF family phenazine biosynthesis protein